MRIFLHSRRNELQWHELAVVCACGLSGSQLVAYQSGEQLLGLDQGNLYVAVGISLQEQLLLNAFGQDCEYSHGFFRQAAFDERIFFLPGRQCIERICLAAC